MLPNPQHAPTPFSESVVHDPVTHYVTQKFPSPEDTITSWLRAMVGAAVPKTTVHKKRDTLLWKYEIGIAEYVNVATPSHDSMATEETNKRQLSALIVARENARHNS